VNALRILLKPFTPFSAEKLRVLLNLEEEYEPTSEVEQKGRVSKYEDQWEFKQLKAGHQLGTPEILFAKLEYTEQMEQQDKG
jgi:methionyl-tRNA synthetase